MSNPGKSSLFVGDLAIFCTEDDLHKTFQPYGVITEVKIMRSEETKRNLSYGFIKFATAASAREAMAKLNGNILCGRPLR
jgi:polyadenylate-binding protein